MAGGYAVTISATDAATATINKVNKALAGTLAPINRLGGALSRLGDTTGVSRLGSGLANLEQQARRTADGMVRIIPALSAITGAASLAGLAQLSSKWSEFGDRLGFTAQRIGVSTQQLQGLQGAARLAGASSEAMTGGLRGLQQTLQDAVGGRNNEAVILFNKLGLSFRDAQGNARGVTDVLPELADKIAAIKNPQLQAMVATQMFGGAAEDLLPLLRQGSAGLRSLTEEAGRYGLMTDKGRETARGFAAAQARLGLAVEGLGNSVAEKLTPVLIPLLNRLAEWIGSHSDQIAAFFERVATAISTWVSNGGVQDMLARLETFATKVDAVVQAFGGWEVAAKALGVVLAVNLLLPLTGVVGKMVALGAIKPAAWMLRLLGVGGGIAAAGAVAGGVAAHYADKDDKAGGWVDRNVPGAAWFDDWMARHTGLGLTHDQQREKFGGGGMNTGSGPGGMTPGEANRGGRAQSSPTTRTFDTTMSPQSRALLDTIAGTESPGYNVMYGGRRFTDMSQHPNVNMPIGSGPNAGRTSSAAGRYQFLKSTWDEAAVATGAKDFSPASQDKGAWWLAQRDYNQRTGRDLAGDLQSKDPRVKAGIGPALHGTWTSLPGGIEAGTTNDRFTRQLDAGTDRYKREMAPNGVPPVGPAFGPPAPPAPAPPAPGPAAPGIQQPAQDPIAGRVAVDVTHRGDPGNTTVRIGTSGAAEQDKLRVERAPLLMGIP